MDQVEFEHIAKDLRLVAERTARAYNVDTHGAEDVAQETLLRLWTARSDIDNQDAAERLARVIAHNLAIDLTRKRRVVPIDARLELIADREPSPDTLCEISENEEWLVRRMEALPSTEHMILRMRQVERKTNDEIATLLGMEKTSVATMLSRARNKILNDFKRRTR